MKKNYSPRLSAFAAGLLIMAAQQPSAALAQQLVFGPEWSPDGSLIAFTANRVDGGDPEIFVIRPDGSGMTQITKNQAFEAHPTFSPDGKSLYFTTSYGSPEAEIRDRNMAKAPLNGGEIEIVFGDGGVEEVHPFFMPDGRLGYSRRALDDRTDTDLWVWDPVSGESRQLIDLPKPANAGVELIGDAAASGNEFVFNDRKTGHSEIYTMSLENSDVEQITGVFRNNPGPDGGWLGYGGPSISADGSRVVVWTDQTGEGPWSNVTHMVFDRATGEVIRLPKSQTGRFYGYAGISADGTKIAFPSSIGDGAGGPWGLFVQDIETGDVREIWRNDG